MTDENPIALDDLATAVTAYEQADLREKQAAAEKQEWRAVIEDAMSDHTVGTIGGVEAVRWTYVTSSRVDTRKVKSLLTSEQLDQVTTVTESRRFTITPRGQQ